jgi:hypothetical protein
MKKSLQLLLLSSVLLSLDVNASCSVLAHLRDEQITGDIRVTLTERHDYNITNETSTIQTYQIFHEFSTQNYDHKEKITNAYWEIVTLNPGQSLGSTYRWLDLIVKYPHNPQGYIQYSMDSIIEIHGECHALTHLIRRLRVY